MFTGVINTDNSEQVGGNVSVLQQDGSGNLKVSGIATTGALNLPGLSANALNALLIPITDVSNYKSFSLETSGTYNLAVAIQASNDMTNWYNVFINDTTGGIINQQGYGGVSYNGIFKGNISYHYLRGSVVSYTSGTINGNLLLSGDSIPFFLESTLISDKFATLLNIIGNGNTFADTLTGILQYGKSGTTGASAIARPLLVESDGTVHVLENNSAASKSDLDTIAAAQVAQGSTTSGQNGPLMQAAVTTSSPTYTNGQTSPITQTPSGGVRVAQSGNWTIQPGNTPNTSPWLFQLQGAQTTFISAGTSGNTVIKASPGTFFGIFASTAAAGGGLVYDNATTNSGTPVGAAPTAVGFDQGVPAGGVTCVNGITVAGSATNPALTVFWR